MCKPRKRESGWVDLILSGERMPVSGFVRGTTARASFRESVHLRLGTMTKTEC